MYHRPEFKHVCTLECKEDWKIKTQPKIWAILSKEERETRNMSSLPWSTFWAGPPELFIRLT